ncbi:hypothetical protein MBLNU459_g4771t1 [Dothideomycetes sp. NU459]
MKFTAFACAISFAACVYAHNPQKLSVTQTRRLHEARSLCSRDLHCILAHEATEGPFYIPDPLLRTNITEDRDGIPLTLRIEVLDVTQCAPAKDVWVDIWHADAHGEYSGWASGEAVSLSQDVHSLMTRNILSNAGGPPPFGSHEPEFSSRFLRGVTMTDRFGIAEFDTIMPAWYEGRTTHVHIRIHTGNVTFKNGMLVGAGTVAHTGQLFFPDELVTELAKKTEPYKTHAKTLKPKLNRDDGIYTESDGKEQVLTIDSTGPNYKAFVSVGVDPSADHAQDDHGPGFGGPNHGRTVVLVILILSILLVAGGIALRRYRQRQAVRYVSLSTEEQGDESIPSNTPPAYRDG